RRGIAGVVRTLDVVVAVDRGAETRAARALVAGRACIAVATRGRIVTRDTARLRAARTREARTDARRRCREAGVVRAAAVVSDRARIAVRARGARRARDAARHGIAGA